MKNKLSPCPLCGCEEFNIHDKTNNSNVVAIFCKECPYGVEDARLTFEELIKTHNTRIDKNSNRYNKLNNSQSLVVIYKEDMREGAKNLLGKKLNRVLDGEK